MATMNKVEQAFHDLIISNLGNIRENGPSKTADRYKPSSRFASLNKEDAAIFKKLSLIHI